MNFDDILQQTLSLLHRQGRVSYRALQRRFDLADDYLEDLKGEILFAYPQVVDAEGRGLAWTGGSPPRETEAWRGTEAERRFHALLPGVMGLLQREGRVTYRTLKYVFGLDEAFLEEVRQELLFKQVARDEQGEGLVWTGEAPPVIPPAVAVPRQPATAQTTTVPSPAPPTLPPPITAVDTPSNGLTASSETMDTDVPPDESVGTPEPVRHAPEAERRQLTVMFCDLVGSTQLSGHLDPEDLRQVVRAYQATAADVIQQYAGHIAQYLGDGLLVYFGYPTAHEDDARRAVHTGLGIVQAIATLNTRLAAQYDVQLAVRLGIHTGPVVVGQMGSGGRHEHLALGETPNIAARLQGLAPANAVVISAVTARLVQGTFSPGRPGDPRPPGGRRADGGQPGAWPAGHAQP